MSNTAIVVSSWCLIGIGLVVLVLVIPLCGSWLKDTEAKTEFFSARAAYWCVIMGLFLLGIAVAGRQIEDIAAVLRRQ